MAATLISRLLGFVRQAVINAIFGASGSADVLNAVFNIPNNLRKLLAEGALSSAFIPVLSQSLANKEERAAGVPQMVVRNILSFQALILIPLLVLSVFFARPITLFILDFPEVERQILAADLFRWFIHYTLLISISAVMMGSLNSSNKFAVPAFTPIVFSVFVVGSVLLFYRTMGVYSMAVGILAGGLGQMLFQTPQFLSSGFGFRPSFKFRNPYFRRVLRQWLPVVASSSIFAVNQFFAIFFASGLEDGSSSALSNAIVFWQLPLGIFGVSVTTVLFPRMSREAVGSDLHVRRGTIAYGVRAISALLIPSAVILGALSFEIIAVAFQRGAFTAANTLMAARVLIGYCLGMVGVGLFNFLQRSFYARGDYKTPTLTALVVLILDVLLSLTLKETALRVVGLAVANSIAFSAGALILLFFSHRSLKGLEGRSILATAGKASAATVPVLAVLLVFRRLWGQLWQTGSTGANLGILLAVGLVAVGIIGGLYWILRIEVVAILLKRRAK
jgi:putative peptidoglycan lipid II flippase